MTEPLVYIWWAASLRYWEPRYGKRRKGEKV